MEASNPENRAERRKSARDPDRPVESSRSRDGAIAGTEDRGFRCALRVVVASLAILLALAALFSFRTVVLSAFIGVMIGVLPEPLIRWLRGRTGLPRAASAPLLVLLALCGFAALGYAIYLAVVPEISRLVEQAPAIVDRLNQFKDQMISRLPWLNFDPKQLDIGAMVRSSAQLLLAGISVGVGGLAYAAIIVMIAIFVASNHDGYARGALTLFAPDRRPRVRELADGAARVLRRWFVGHMVVVAISGTLTAIALALIGVDFWLLIAALTMVLDFVPFIGAVLTGSVAVILTLGTAPDRVIWVLLVFVAIQQIESHIVLPIVMKESIRLPEAHLLVFVIVMGTAFGIIGVFVAPPLFAVMHHLYTQAYVPWIEGRRTGSGRTARGRSGAG